MRVKFCSPESLCLATVGRWALSFAVIETLNSPPFEIEMSLLSPENRDDDILETIVEFIFILRYRIFNLYKVTPIARPGPLKDGCNKSKFGMVRKVSNTSSPSKIWTKKWLIKSAGILNKWLAPFSNSVARCSELILLVVCEQSV